MTRIQPSLHQQNLNMGFKHVPAILLNIHEFFYRCVKIIFKHILCSILFIAELMDREYKCIA